MKAQRNSWILWWPRCGKSVVNTDGLGDVLAGMGGVAVLARLGVAELLGGSLVSAAARAEDAVRDVVRAMVTPHGLPPRADRWICWQPQG